MTYVTGWKSEVPRRVGVGRGGGIRPAPPQLVAQGPRHAVPVGTSTSLCGQPMVQVDEDREWTHGGLGRPCVDCEQRVASA